MEESRTLDEKRLHCFSTDNNDSKLLPPQTNPSNSFKLIKASRFLEDQGDVEEPTIKSKTLKSESDRNRAPDTNLETPKISMVVSEEEDLVDSESDLEKKASSPSNSGDSSNVVQALNAIRMFLDEFEKKLQTNFQELSQKIDRQEKRVIAQLSVIENLQKEILLKQQEQIDKHDKTVY